MRKTINRAWSGIWRPSKRTICTLFGNVQITIDANTFRIPGLHAEQPNRFNHEVPSTYLNYHPLSCFPSNQVDAKTKAPSED